MGCGARFVLITVALTVRDLQVGPEQMIQSPTPLEIFTKFHDMFCLVVGQGKIFEIASEYPLRFQC